MVNTKTRTHTHTHTRYDKWYTLFGSGSESLLSVKGEFGNCDRKAGIVFKCTSCFCRDPSQWKGGRV